MLRAKTHFLQEWTSPSAWAVLATICPLNAFEAITWSQWRTQLRLPGSPNHPLLRFHPTPAAKISLAPDHHKVSRTLCKNLKMSTVLYSFRSSEANRICPPYQGKHLIGLVSESSIVTVWEKCLPVMLINCRVTYTEMHSPRNSVCRSCISASCSRRGGYIYL